VLLQACGVEVARALVVLAGGFAGNRIFDRKRALARDFRLGFRIDLHHKDLGNLVGLAAFPARRCGHQLSARCRWYPLTGEAAPGDHLLTP
jgi:3-hydroxyisobutyrate dehydrogenase-like beta-hydroxyacid dehydrogenase